MELKTVAPGKDIRTHVHRLTLTAEDAFEEAHLVKLAAYIDAHGYDFPSRPEWAEKPVGDRDDRAPSAKAAADCLDMIGSR